MKKEKNNFIVKGSILGGLIGFFVNTYNQNQIISQDPNKKFNYLELLKASLTGAFIGGVSAAFIRFILSVFDNNVTEIIDESDEIAYLGTVIGSYKPNHRDYLVYNKGRLIKKAIYDEFNDQLLGRPTNQGSVDQGTALSGISDLDILVKFKKTSCYSEEHMFNKLYKFLRYKFQDTDLVRVRRQKVSIGLIFEFNGEKETIDIVPALRTDFIRGKNDYSLYKNLSFTKLNTPINMNPYKQKDFGYNEADKKEIIKLLKILKNQYELPLKSFLIKELVKMAFESKKNIPNTINEQLLMTLKYIRDNIVHIKIKSPDNPESYLTDLLSHPQKKNIELKLDDIINGIKEDKDNLIKYFPINSC